MSPGVKARLVVFVPVLLAAAAIGATWTNQALPQAARIVACAFAGVGFLVGVFGTRPEIRSHATVALGAAAVVAAGQTRAGRAYIAVTVLFALASVWSIRQGRGARTPRYRGPSVARAIVLLFGAGVGFALFTALPPIARRIENRVGRYFDPDDMPVGFNSRLPLGTTRRMMKSNRIVLRVHGESVDYLRGAILDSYDGRVWTSSLAKEKQPPIPSVPIEATTTRIVFAGSAPIAKPPENRWFLPANACNLHADGRIFPDGTGIARPELPEEDTIALQVKGCEAPTLASPPPGPKDLAIPPFRELARTLTPMAARWTDGATTDREKVERISKELQKWKYSLEVQRNDRVDPVYDFLAIHKEGHCEMFASALALLARTQGIPTRLVSGYRVSETSPVFDYAVVRERNAHAWVEVWLEGKWHAFDPTPQVEVFSSTQPGFGDRVGDLVSYVWDAGLPWVLAALVALGVLAWYARGWIRAIRARFFGGAGALGESTPGFLALEGALAQVGHVRPPSEPIERFARRLTEAGAPWSADVARVLGDYAALRYGGHGDESAIAKDLEKAASTIRSVNA